jgi:replicative DNA helicase
VAARLSADDFFHPSHREVFDAMMAVSKRGEPIDPVFIGNELKTRGVLVKLEGGEEYLSTLYSSVPTSENVGHYVDLVLAASLRRQVIYFCALHGSKAYEQHGSPEGLLRGMRDDLVALIGRVKKAGGQKPLKAVG